MKRKAPKRKTKKASRKTASSKAGATFNHAMIYVRSVPAALNFYRDRLGLQVLQRFGDGYARLRTPGDTTIALHQIGEDVTSTDAPGIRLYFEVKDLEAFCRRLAASGVHFKQMPKLMPWGWQHAYLNDPDGHEVSLYWAGAKRLAKT